MTRRETESGYNNSSEIFSKKDQRVWLATWDCGNIRFSSDLNMAHLSVMEPVEVADWTFNQIESPIRYTARCLYDCN